MSKDKTNPVNQVSDKDAVLFTLLIRINDQSRPEEERKVLHQAFTIFTESLISIDKKENGDDVQVSLKAKRGVRKGKGHKQRITEIAEHEYIRDTIKHALGIVEKLEKDQVSNLLKVGVHAANQFFNNPKLPASIKETGRAEQYGLVLTRTQHQVFEGILKAFTQTNYRGHRQLDTNQYSREFKNIDRSHKAYTNIPTIPIIRLTQTEIIQLSGLNRGNRAEVISALEFLGEYQWKFYWERLMYDDNEKPMKKKNGDYRKEEISKVDTLFDISTVKEDGLVKYYEIAPAPILLDQVSKDYGGNYFLLVPAEWREEVRKLVGPRASDYIYRFLSYLRTEHENIRRHNSNKYKKQKRPFEITKRWEEIAHIIKMPESIYKRKKQRGEKLVIDAYTAAVKLGYLSKVEMTGNLCKLYLNTEYYPKPNNKL